MISDARAKELVDLGNGLYNSRWPLMSFWQEVAENFYVERANFTSELVLGDDFAGHLSDSFPTLLRRETGNQITSILRPRDRQWFWMTTGDEDRDGDNENSKYLEYAVRKMKAAMYDQRTMFVRATKETDHDFVTFGQGVMSVEESPDRTHLFYRSFHLRDCAWMENGLSEIDHLHRKDEMTARKMRMIFGEDNLHQTVKDACKKNPNQKFNIRCIVMPRDEYDYIDPSGSKGKGGSKAKFVVIYVDADNCKVLREGKLPDFPYVVPRWHTVSGWQYAYSPCTTIALPDARLAQEMARIILESGEKQIDPPLIAVEEAVREVNIAAGAITWADLSHDGKLQDVVKPLALQNNMEVAFSMRQDLREMLQKAWFVDKLQLPAPERDMTAYETARRLEEFVRNLLPLFEPMEVEYNTRLLDKTWNLMLNMSAFQSDEVPQDLQNAETQWQFESPLQSSAQRLAVTQFQEALGLIGAGVQGGVKAIPIDLDIALKDALKGTQMPATWFRDDEEVAQELAQGAEKQAMMEQMQQLQSGALIAKDMGEAGQSLNNAMTPPQPQGFGGMPALPPPDQEAA